MCLGYHEFFIWTVSFVSITNIPKFEYQEETQALCLDGASTARPLIKDGVNRNINLELKLHTRSRNWASTGLRILPYVYKIQKIRKSNVNSFKKNVFLQEVSVRYGKIYAKGPSGYKRYHWTYLWPIGRLKVGLVECDCGQYSTVLWQFINALLAPKSRHC